MIHVAHDSNHRRTRYTFRRYALFTGRGLNNIFLCLFFKADYVGVCPEESRHLAGELGVERLIDGGEHAPHEQPRNQILRANSQLFGQILDADALGDRDASSNRQRFVRDRKPWRRYEAPQRAFFSPAGNIALAGPARRCTRAAARTLWTGWRQAWPDSEWSRTCW